MLQPEPEPGLGFILTVTHCSKKGTNAVLTCERAVSALQDATDLLRVSEQVGKRQITRGSSELHDYRD